MQPKFRISDPIIIIGVAISILVSVILVFIGQDGVISLLVGLIITTITLLIDVINRAMVSERRILDASILGNAVIDDLFLHSKISEIINDYEKVKQWENSFFTERANEVLLDCRNAIHGLAEGQMLIDEGKFKFNYGDRANRNVKVVVCADPKGWKTDYGKNLIRANKRAIDRGVKFTHLWIQNNEVLSDYRELLFKLKDMGIDVRVASPVDIPNYLIEHYRIVDDQKLIKLELGGDGKRRGQRIFISRSDVERAIHEFYALLEYTQPLQRYFED